jgi:hypothetical protein
LGACRRDSMVGKNAEQLRLKRRWRFFHFVDEN